MGFGCKSTLSVSLILLVLLAPCLVMTVQAEEASSPPPLAEKAVKDQLEAFVNESLAFFHSLPKEKVKEFGEILSDDNSTSLMTRMREYAGRLPSDKQKKFTTDYFLPPAEECALFQKVIDGLSVGDRQLLGMPDKLNCHRLLPGAMPEAAGNETEAGGETE